MTARITLFTFGKVDAPLVADENGCLSSSISFEGKDIVYLLEQLHEKFSSSEFYGPKRTIRQKEISELSNKLKRLIAKEKHITGYLWSPFIRPTVPTQKK